MTVPSTKGAGVGLRNITVYALDANGYPAPADESPYEGLQMSGCKTVGLENPDPQQIVHTGCDQVFGVDLLPPTEAVSGEITVGAYDDALRALLSGVTVFSVGESQAIGVGTSKQGSEPQVGVLVYRQALDMSGNRVWRWKLLPKALLYAKVTPFEEKNPEAGSYTLLPQFVEKHLWGVSFTEVTEGFTRAQFLEGTSEYKPKIVSFLGDGTIMDFSFPTEAPAQAITKVSVWVDGVLDETVTVTTTGISFLAAPGVGSVIVVWYEHE